MSTPHAESEVNAAIAALRYAVEVAKEQCSPAYVSVEAGDYSVGETRNIVGRLVCTVDETGDIIWA